jgi:hypothetical protein
MSYWLCDECYSVLHDVTADIIQGVDLRVATAELRQTRMLRAVLTWTLGAIVLGILMGVLLGVARADPTTAPRTELSAQSR